MFRLVSVLLLCLSLLVQMNCACRAISFVDEHTLVTSGLDAEVYVWGLQVTHLDLSSLYIPCPYPPAANHAFTQCVCVGVVAGEARDRIGSIDGTWTVYRYVGT